jgi:tetratricopeptide (TPR) repeat protein
MRRLDSWKDIASYLNREERTVRRWEKDRSLPVHRIPGRARSGVFAFAEELDAWLSAPEGVLEAGGLQGSDPGGKAPGDPANGKGWRRWILLGTAMVLAAALVLHSRRGNSAPAGLNPRQPLAPAMDLYLKGRYQWNLRTPDSLRKSQECFNQALALDPRMARAHAGLADTYNLLREYSIMRGEEAYPKALASARRAIELDPKLPEAHRAMAFVLFNWAWDFEGAEREYRQAIALDPQDAGTHHWLGTALGDLGRYDAALEELDEARKLNPASASIQADRACILFKAGREEEARTVLHQLASAEPGFLSPHRYLAGIAFATGDIPTYLAEARLVAGLMHDPAAQAIVDRAREGFEAGGERGFYRTLEKAQAAQNGDGHITG